MFQAALTSTGQPMTQEEVEDMMRLADTNKDGVLQYEGKCTYPKLKVQNLQLFLAIDLYEFSFNMSRLEH